MPYYVFSIQPPARIEKLAEFGAFNEASAHAKALRTAPPASASASASASANTSASADIKIKVMFADNEQLALDLLRQVRTPGPTGDE